MKLTDMWMSSVFFISLLAFSHGAAAAEKHRVLVSFETNSRAAIVSLSASLTPLEVSVLKTSERHGVAVLEGSPEAIKTAAESLPGGITVEEPVPRMLHACDNQCIISDSSSSTGRNETLPWGVKFVQANSTEAGPESLINSSVWICIIDTGRG